MASLDEKEDATCYWHLWSFMQEQKPGGCNLKKECGVTANLKKNICQKYHPLGKKKDKKKTKILLQGEIMTVNGFILFSPS